jgi:hypothetical protein
VLSPVIEEAVELGHRDRSTFCKMLIVLMLLQTKEFGVFIYVSWQNGCTYLKWE